MTLAFPDTNILIYAFDEGAKTERARSIVEAGGVLSTQSLNEFANVARKKLRFSWPDVRAAIERLLVYFPQIVALDLSLHSDATRIAERYQLSMYDGLIVAAALRAGCTTLWSEDLHHGLVVDGQLTIRNPFT